MAGRTKKPVDVAVLRAAIQEAEKNGPLPNLDALWKKAAEIYNSKFGVPDHHITFSVVLLRVKELGIETQTKPGRRKGQGLSPEHKAAMQAGRSGRRSRAEKFADDPAKAAAFKDLRAEAKFIADGTERFLPIVEKIEAGSLTAAVRLNCLQCVGGSTGDVRGCEVTRCPLWAFRPYQGVIGSESEDSSEDSEVLDKAA